MGIQLHHIILGEPSAKRDIEMWYALNYFKSLGAKPVIGEERYIRHSTFERGGCMYIDTNGQIGGNCNKYPYHRESIEIKMPRGLFQNNEDFVL